MSVQTSKQKKDKKEKEKRKKKKKATLLCSAKQHPFPTDPSSVSAHIVHPSYDQTSKPTCSFFSLAENMPDLHCNYNDGLRREKLVGVNTVQVPH